MKNFLDPISNEFAYSMGWTLLHSLWQGTGLVLIAAVLLFFLKERSAKLRYTLSLSFMALQLFLSALTFIYYYGQITSAVAVVSPIAPESFLYAGMEIESQLSVYQKITLWLNLHFAEIVFCWLAGTGALALRLTGSWLFLKRLRYYAQPVTNPVLLAKFEMLLQRFNISQHVDFRESSRILSPMVIGVARPLVLVPIGMFTGFTASQIEAVLAHELAHIRRYDYLINLLQSIIEIIFFFHPAIWWLSVRINTERENCCDDLALTVCEDRMALAHALVKVAEQQLTLPLAMALNSNKNVLMNRVRRVVGLAPAPNRTFNLLPSVLLLLGLLAGVSVYALDQKEESKSEAKKPKIETDTTTNKMVLQLTERADSVVNKKTKTLSLAKPHVFGDQVHGDSGMAITINADSMINVVVNEAFETANIPASVTFRAASDKPVDRKRLEELRLDIEQQIFARERLNREKEKLNWKKRTLAESRSETIREQARLFSEDKKTAIINEAEQEKQLASLEQKIKQDEQKITQLSNAISALVLEDFKTQEKIQTIEKEMREKNYGNTALFLAEPFIPGNPVIEVQVAPIPPKPATRSIKQKVAKDPTKNK